MSQHPVLCVGCINWDIVLHTPSIPDPDHSSPIKNGHMSSGGSSTNTALALSSFTGFDVSIIGNVGEDKYGDFALEALTDGGVTPIVDRGNVPTTIVYAVITEGADPRYFARDEVFGEASINRMDNENWEHIEHVHLTSFHPEIAGEIAQRAKEDGKTVSFNPSQGYENNEFPNVVEAADLLFLNERENTIFRTRYNFGQIASQTHIVLTQGSAGSTAYSPEGVTHHSGFTVDEIQDTIGAGDAFVAGFLSEWLNNGSMETALAVGNASGAYTVQFVGSPDNLDEEWVMEKVQQDGVAPEISSA